MSESRDFHRVFALAWADFFEGTSVDVESEIDTSAQKQRLDVVIIRRPPGLIPRPLPDGFEDLARYNLITFKSYQQTMDPWAIHELLGHYVAYRKLSSPNLDNLLPKTDYKLFAVSARFPRNLLEEMDATPIGDGVYEFRRLGHAIRLIVANQLPQTPNNAMIQLFSAQQEVFRYAVANYHTHSPDSSSLIYKVFDIYSKDPDMNSKLKEFNRENIDQFLRSLPPEELRNHLPIEERLKGVSAEERLKGVSAEDLLKGLSPEALQTFIERLKTNPIQGDPN